MLMAEFEARSRLSLPKKIKMSSGGPPAEEVKCKMPQLGNNLARDDRHLFLRTDSSFKADKDPTPLAACLDKEIVKKATNAQIDIVQLPAAARAAKFVALQSQPKQVRIFPGLKDDVEKAKPAKGAKSKAREKPKRKRPLTAYNLFYRFKRSKILQNDSRENITRLLLATPGLEDYPSTSIPDTVPAERVEEIRRSKISQALLENLLPKEGKHYSNHRFHPSISFKEVNGIISARWKTIDDFSRGVFEELAEEGRRMNQKRAAEPERANPSSSKETMIGRSYDVPPRSQPGTPRVDWHAGAVGPSISPYGAMRTSFSEFGSITAAKVASAAFSHQNVRVDPKPEPLAPFPGLDHSTGLGGDRSLSSTPFVSDAASSCGTEPSGEFAPDDCSGLQLSPGEEDRLVRQEMRRHPGEPAFDDCAELQLSRAEEEELMRRERGERDSADDFMSRIASLDSCN